MLSSKYKTHLISLHFKVKSFHFFSFRPRITKVYYKRKYFMIRVRDKNVSSPNNIFLHLFVLWCDLRKCNYSFAVQNMPFSFDINLYITALRKPFNEQLSNSFVKCFHKISFFLFFRMKKVLMVLNYPVEKLANTCGNVAQNTGPSLSKLRYFCDFIFFLNNTNEFMLFLQQLTEKYA